MDDSKNKAKNDQGGQPQQPVTPPAGSVNKEAPPHISTDSLGGENLMTPTEQEVVITEELERAGMKVESEAPPLKTEHREVGMEHSGENVPVPNNAPPSHGFSGTRMPKQETSIILKTMRKAYDWAKLWLATSNDKQDKRQEAT